MVFLALLHDIEELWAHCCARCVVSTLVTGSDAFCDAFQSASVSLPLWQWLIASIYQYILWRGAHLIYISDSIHMLRAENVLR